MVRRSERNERSEAGLAGNSCKAYQYPYIMTGIIGQETYRLALGIGELGRWPAAGTGWAGPPANGDGIADLRNVSMEKIWPVAAAAAWGRICWGADHRCDHDWWGWWDGLDPMMGKPRPNGSGFFLDDI